MTSDLRESQLPLPPLLSQLIASKRWRQPSDKVIFAAVPFLREPVDFLLTEAHMRFESQGQCVDMPTAPPFFHEYRGSESEARPLPWLDVDLALMIAVNRIPGADLGIALDYRTCFTDPRIVVSDWWTGDETCHWREAFSSFSAFVAAIRV